MVEASENTIAESITSIGKIVLFLNKLIKPISMGGLALAATMLAIMMFLTFFDVAGRYFLNKPIFGSFELLEFIMSIMTGFGIGYCAFRRGHIRVDLIMQYTSRKTNCWLNLFACGSACIFSALMTWQSCLGAFSLMRSNLASSVLLIPVYPFVFILVIAVAILTLIFLKDTIQSIDEVIKL